MSAVLEVRHLHVAYGKVEAVHDVSLTVVSGTIVSVIGPNGAGKTTLLAAVMGLLPSRGTVDYLGESAAMMPVEQRVASSAHSSAFDAANGIRKRRSPRSTGAFRGLRNGAISSPGHCRAANARCWRWDAR